MKKIFWISVFTLFIFPCEFSFSQAKFPSFIKDSLDRYIQRSIEKWEIPGIAVGIVKDGKIILVKGYGKRALNKAEKVDENTLFMIGSNTKAFTGTVMAWLDYEKKCSLNDKVVSWLPDFTMKDTWVAKELTLTDILCHRIGMETFQGDFMYWTSNLSGAEVIKKFGQLTPLFNFRTRWGYTNAGFQIAGECIKKISGLPWSEFVKKRIFEPLKMTRTVALSVDIPKQENVASAHTIENGILKVIPIPDIDNLAPAASIGSSAADMCQWLICQLDSGRYEKKQMIPWPVINKTREPQSIRKKENHPFNKTHYSLYALGWSLMDYEGREIVSHTGGVNGFVTSVTMLPEEKLGVVVLTNTDQNYFFEALKWEIIDSYLNLPYRNYSRLYLNYFKNIKNIENEQLKGWTDTVKMVLKPAFNLKEFTGRYSHEAYGNIDIEQEGTKLKMKFEHHNMTGTLECLGGKRFLCTYSDPEFGIKVIPFKIENNKIRSFILTVAEFIEFTDYEFVKK
ncbi:MAG: serine hydrolase [Bacteroidia bacterium]|nr:serine hydrolase [Bacteroidia bacterium]